MVKYTLPELSYAYDALEPHISSRVLELHHGVHHAAYVSNANAAIEELDAVDLESDPSGASELERKIAFNLSGHVLHSLLWTSLTPRGPRRPEGELLGQIDNDFRSFDRFKRIMTGAAENASGSGWAALVWEPVGRRLFVASIHDHQSGLFPGVVPLMVIDAWEHAYYLQYENRKSEFFAAHWSLWDWTSVAKRFEAAKSNRLLL